MKPLSHHPDAPGHTDHHAKSWKVAELFERYLGAVIAVGVVVLLAGLFLRPDRDRFEHADLDAVTPR